MSAADGGLNVTIINKDLTRSTRVEIRPVAERIGSYLVMSAPGGGAATSGFLLGGTPIGRAGSWTGAWSPVQPAPADGIAIQLPACSAGIIRLGPPRGPSPVSVPSNLRERAKIAWA